MEYKLPDLQPYFEKCGQGTAYKGNMIKDAMRQYAEQAVSPLLAEIERLEKLLAVHPNVGIQQANSQMGNSTFDAYLQSIYSGRS